MPTTSFDVESIKNSIVGKLQRYYGVTVADATPQQLYPVPQSVGTALSPHPSTVEIGRASCRERV